MNVSIERCMCGHPACKTYGVSNGTFYQGCGWGKHDAEFVAFCFNNRQIIEENMEVSYSESDTCG